MKLIINGTKLISAGEPQNKTH